MNDSKTLIGKNDTLFLENDSGNELPIHCNNLNKVFDKSLSRYSFENFMIFVFPDKCLLYKKFLPDNYVVKYRPALDVYKNALKNKVYDLLNILKKEEDIYYKTDTHINLKGSYIVYKFFIEAINLRYNLQIVPKKLNIVSKSCNLSELKLGIGDLTWSSNLGDKILNNTEDNYYYCDELPLFYCRHRIKNEERIRFLDYKLNDITLLLENNIVSWDILSNNIICINNNVNNKLKVVVFYDSYLAHSLNLYFDIFDKTYFIKDTYSNDLINFIKPDYVFEFRIERFLF